MLFNSFEFLFLFLPLVLISYYIAIYLRLSKIACTVLFAASCFFYAYWDYHYLALLLLSIIGNFVCGYNILSSQTRKKTWLCVGIASNLALLFYYKYAAFTFSFLHHVGLSSFTVGETILPLGISFFTFTQIAFLVDAYKGKTAPLTPINYGLFVTIFPHLIAGPILHHRDMMDQFQSSRTFTVSPDMIMKGIILFAIGLFKKIIVADHIAPFVKIIFSSDIGPLHFIDAWGGALAYTLQLYYDFSGYSDMAVGLGYLLNIQFPLNFDSPYKAQSMTDFWRRWHISLSQFLRDYVYIPLGGNRGGEFRKMVNLMLTMLVGGIWHGAGWTFIIWGALHGFYLLLNHLWKRFCPSLPTLVAWPLTFFAVVIGWVFFRSVSFPQAFSILYAMGGGTLHSELTRLLDWKVISTLGGILAFTVTMPNSTQLIAMERKPSKRLGAAVAVLVFVCVLFFNRVSEFLYYQF
jgi:alginate O-acetyltransferase complex protein AlgI